MATATKHRVKEKARSRKTATKTRAQLDRDARINATLNRPPAATALARRHRAPDVASPAVVGGQVVQLDGSIASPIPREAQKILLAEPRNDEVDILPTGEVYAPWHHTARRLNEAFGVGAWRVVAQTEPMQKNNVIVQQFMLMAGDYILARDVWGWHDHYPNNARTNWADAVESCKSRALARLGKGAGLFNNRLSDKRWCANWRRAHAVAVLCEVKKWDAQKRSTVTKKDQLMWRRKDAADKLPGETRLASDVEIAQKMGEPVDAGLGYTPPVATTDQTAPPAATTSPSTAVATTQQAQPSSARTSPPPQLRPPGDPETMQRFLSIAKHDGMNWAVTAYANADGTVGGAEYAIPDANYLQLVQQLIPAQTPCRLDWVEGRTPQTRGKFKLTGISR